MSCHHQAVNEQIPLAFLVQPRHCQKLAVSINRRHLPSRRESSSNRQLSPPPYIPNDGARVIGVKYITSTWTDALHLASTLVQAQRDAVDLLAAHRSKNPSRLFLRGLFGHGSDERLAGGLKPRLVIVLG